MEHDDKEAKGGERRADWELNHALIQTSYLRLFRSLKRVPVMDEVAKDCNLSRQTVWRHYRSIRLEDVSPSLKIRADRVLFGLATKAEQGDASAAKLYFQLVFGWREASEHHISALDKLRDVDLSTVSTDRLERIARGEPIESVLADRVN